VLWGGLMVLAGFLAGNSWHTVAHLLSGAGIALAALLVAVFVGLHLVRRHGWPGALRHALHLPRRTRSLPAR
jgi:membrane protein DedA with SNARE-associated domain